MPQHTYDVMQLWNPARDFETELGMLDFGLSDLVWEPWPRGWPAMLTTRPANATRHAIYGRGVDAFGCVTGIVGDLLPTPAAPNCRLSASARAFLFGQTLGSSFFPASSCFIWAAVWAFWCTLHRPAAKISSPSLFRSFWKHLTFLCRVTQRLRHAVMYVPASCASIEPLPFIFRWVCVSQ